MSIQHAESIKRPALNIPPEKDGASLMASGLHNTAPLIILANGENTGMPVSIWADPLLDAVDVRSWGMVRSCVAAENIVTISLNQLLKERLNYSRATISKVIYVLRLTRWISLCQKPGASEASLTGNRYVVHDAPCSINEGIYLDAHYLGFVEKQLTHACKQIRDVAQIAWNDYQASRLQDDHAVAKTSREGSSGFIRQLNQHARLIRHDDHTENPLIQKVKQGTEASSGSGFIRQLNQNARLIRYVDHMENPLVQKLNQGTDGRVQKLNPLTEDYKPDEKQRVEDQVQKLNLTEVVCSSSSLFNNKNTTTTTSPAKLEIETDLKTALIFPSEFNASEIQLAKIYLKRVEPELQQAFLDETAAKIASKRKTSNPVRNPVGYLCWLCNSHAQGLTALTSLCVRYAEKRALALNNAIKTKPEKPKIQINPARQATDNKSVIQRAETYKSRIIDLRASLNASKNNAGAEQGRTDRRSVLF